MPSIRGGLERRRFPVLLAILDHGLRRPIRARLHHPADLGREARNLRGHPPRRLTADAAGAPGATIEILSENQGIWPNAANPFTTTTTLASTSVRRSPVERATGSSPSRRRFHQGASSR